MDQVTIFSTIMNGFVNRKISCDQANLPYTTVYADTVGTTVKDVRIRNGGIVYWILIRVDKVIYMMGLEASYSGLSGAFNIV